MQRKTKTNDDYDTGIAIDIDIAIASKFVGGHEKNDSFGFFIISISLNARAYLRCRTFSVPISQHDPFHEN